MLSLFFSLPLCLLSNTFQHILSSTMQQQPTGGGQVFTNFDDLFAARTGAAGGTLPQATTTTTTTQPTKAFPLATAPPAQLIDFFSSPTPTTPTPQTEALLSPRYTTTSTATQFVTPGQHLISPRYVVQTTTVSTTAGPQGTTLPHQMQTLLVQPVQPIQSFSQPQAQAQPSIALWNPFWEDMKVEDVTSPRGTTTADDENVQVHVVTDLGASSTDDADDAEEQAYEKKYRNFELRTSSHALQNSEQRDEEKKRQKREKKKQEGTLSKSKEQPQPREQVAEIEYEHSESLHLGLGGLHLHRHHHVLLEDSEPIRFNWHPKKTAPPKVMKALIQVNCLVKGEFEAPVGMRILLSSQKLFLSSLSD